MNPNWQAAVAQSYSFSAPSILMGAAKLNEVVDPKLPIGIPLSTLNRHGLISGATGTGKTKTLQVLAEQCAQANIPVLLMDIKGDLSGIAKAGSPHPKIDERQQSVGLPFSVKGYESELYSLSGQQGLPVRSTMTEFGPVLLSKLLDLTDTQSGVLTVVFKYCDDHQWPLIDLKDLRKALIYVTEEGKEAVQQTYGRISTASVGAILRKLMVIEQQGGSNLFGEPSFEVADLMNRTRSGYGLISVIRLMDMQDKPQVFSTFMISLLAEIYHTFPEVGDPERPKLMLCFDEAHLLFDQASKALLDQLEIMVRLIRSKGVGLVFCTQHPADLPAAILGQLGFKIQHALRAFSAKDRKDIRLTSQNFPPSEYYQPETLLTELGVGTALMTCLDPKGRPTELVEVMLRAPESRMGVISPAEVQSVLRESRLAAKYETLIDRESAFEILTQKLESATQEAHKVQMQEDIERAKRASQRADANEPSMWESVTDNPMVKQMGKEVVREVTRGLMGILGIKKSRRRRY
ncbi:helicase HerA-like domain-containing protein [Pontibacter sp. G13]|uniref:helicase HerA-like domain-containing protein n=1 Tax=Pontibacter sp. G13 TaxID=3074898 RepID=UPI00288AAAEE|nr:helicase HerA-like domain-containing protein [Pontibacter sp. G13]WNJ17942.1 DUF853 family protein [Pontibacter sp. G13]